MRLFFCILLISGCSLFNPEKYNPNPIAETVIEKECCDKDKIVNDLVDVTERIDVFFTDTTYVDNLVLDTNNIDNLVIEYVYVADPRYSNSDTIFVSVIEYVELVTTDTLRIDPINYVYQTEYIEVSDALLVTEDIVEIQYQDIIICDNPNIEDILDKSFGNNKIYDLNGQVLRRPKGIYIENGKIKYINNLK